MKTELYPSFLNPLLLEVKKPLPQVFAIIGAGTIGPDIGYYLKSAIPGGKLILVDVVEKPLENAKKRYEGYLQKAIDKKKMSAAQAEAVGQNILFTTDYNEIKDADLVIEAATENLTIKRKIIAQVESIVREDTIITSNTSSIPAGRIFSEAKLPGRTTITHFFAPAWQNPAVEVITWEKSNREVVDYLAWMFCTTGKVPIVTQDEICFVLDRIFDNWCNDAAFLLDKATSVQIDKVAEKYVFAGPFFVLNLARGNPIIVETNTLQMEEGEHYRPANILRSVDTWVTAKRGEKVEVDPDTEKFVHDRLLGVLFSQSFDIINRDIGTLEDLNLGCQIALGFRKGPFDIMRDLGKEKTTEIIKGFQQDRPGMPGMEGDYERYQQFKRHLLVDEIDGVKIITIRRPQVMNALSDEVNMEILDVLKAYENDPAVKGFVITGYGERAFCAGADIGKFPTMLGDAAAAEKYAVDCSLLLRYLDQCEKPVVAALNGMALGGGFELALRCHKLVATKEAWLQFPEVTLGILPGIGGMVVPYRRWPQAAAVFNDMIRVAKRLTAQEALDLGVFTALAGDYPSLIKAAVDEVKNMAGQPVPRIADAPVKIEPLTKIENPSAGKLRLSDEAVAIISQAIEEGAAATSFEAALVVGYKAFGKIACTDAAKEGITAFLERRPAEFKK
ncbi:MAG: 3-hydroxyacyl-CoA dehydrogenase NAD-binding domain-containing protein [Bacillota bacterium]